MGSTTATGCVQQLQVQTMTTVSDFSLTWGSGNSNNNNE